MKSDNRFSENIVKWQALFTSLKNSSDYNPEELIYSTSKFLKSEYSISYYAVFINNRISQHSEEYYSERHPYLIQNIKRFNESGILDWTLKKKGLSILPDWEEISSNSSYLVYNMSFNDDNSFLFIGAISKLTDDIGKEEQTEITFFINSLLSYFKPHAVIRENKQLRNQLSFLNKKILQLTRYSTFGEISEMALGSIAASISSFEAHNKLLESGVGNTLARKRIMKNETDKLQEELNALLHIYNDSYSDTDTLIKLNPIFTSLLNSIEHSLSIKAIKLIDDVEMNLPAVRGNYSNLYYIFYNIIKNSIDSIIDEGRVTIQVFFADEHINITFTDNGIGIDERKLNDIFTPFLFADRSKSKSGLSLYIIKNIIQHMRGNISITSIVSSGTTVKITLPILNR